MGALGNQVVLQAAELETIWESGNERSYILSVSFVLDTEMCSWISQIQLVLLDLWIHEPPLDL